MESKNIKDYLHLHLGCEVLYKDEVWILSSVSRPYKTNDTTIINLELRPVMRGFREISYISSSFVDLTLIKLILRKLSDMTEEEANEFKGHSVILEDYINYLNHRDYWSPQEFIWLLSKHFDLFSLIDCGLAIDKNTLK